MSDVFEPLNRAAAEAVLAFRTGQVGAGNAAFVKVVDALSALLPSAAGGEGGSAEGSEGGSAEGSEGGSAEGSEGGSAEGSEGGNASAEQLLPLVQALAEAQARADHLYLADLLQYELGALLARG